MGLSLPKLLGLFAIIWLVWTSFRFFEARQKKHTSQTSDLDTGNFFQGSGVSEHRHDNASVDLQECSICGTWFSGEACTRESCQK